MNIFANVLGGIIHAAAMFYLYSHFLKQYSKKKEFVLAVYAVTGIYGVVYPMFCTMPWQRILCSVVYISAPLFVYREKFPIKLVMFTAFYVVLGFSELLVKSILLGYLGDLTLYYQNFAHHYFIGVMLSSILSFVLLYLFGTSVTLLRSRYPVYLLLIMLIIPVFSVGLFYYLQELVFLVNLQSAYNAYCYITFILLLLN